MSNQDNPIVKVYLCHDLTFAEVPLAFVELPEPSTPAQQVEFLALLQSWYYDQWESVESWGPEYVVWVGELLNSNRVLINTFAHHMNFRVGDNCVERLATIFGEGTKNAEVFRKYVNNESLHTAIRDALRTHPDWLPDYDCIEFAEKDGKFFLQEYRVKYENNCGGEDCIDTFPTAEDAEIVIRQNISAEQSDRFGEQGTVTEFHHKVELTDSDSGDYAVWHKLWVLGGTSIQKEIFVAFFNYHGDLKELADKLSGEFTATVARNSTLCFLTESGEELHSFLEKQGNDFNYSYESPEAAWVIEQ